MDDGINECKIILRRIAYLGEGQVLFCVGFFFQFSVLEQKEYSTEISNPLSYYNPTCNFDSSIMPMLNVSPLESCASELPWRPTFC